MRSLLIMMVMLVAFAGCGKGYRSPVDRDSTEEKELTNMAFDLSTKAEALLQKAPADLTSSLSGFVETSNRLSNAAQRFGGSSLEARDAFDRLKYHAAQLESVITEKSHPQLFPDWSRIMEDMRELGNRLGYKL